MLTTVGREVAENVRLANRKGGEEVQVYINQPGYYGRCNEATLKVLVVSRDSQKLSCREAQGCRS